jgi:transposase InsO family protein
MSANEHWARFRFSVISHLLASPPNSGELRVEIEKLALRQWHHPTTKEPIKFAASTIERWYYLANRNNVDPVAALLSGRRVDAGRQIAIGEALKQALMGQYAAHKSWSVKLHHVNLVALVKMNPELGPAPSYSTVRRFLRGHGMQKRRRINAPETAGTRAAEARLETLEVRSYEAPHVNGLWHWDFHHGSRKVLLANGEWRTPLLLGILDDHSRLACHLQWYLSETAENVAHSLMQAMQKRGLPRAAMSDNGGPMTATEISEGLARLGIAHETTLPYSPYQNGKQESFWGSIEGQLIAMLDNVKDLSLRKLNELTQIWVEGEYNRKLHSEIGTTPIRRFLDAPTVRRPCPNGEILRQAFTRSEDRTLRRSDCTVSIAGRRFEVPSRYRHLVKLRVAYAGWDLSHVNMLDGHSGKVLCRLFPLDKAANADGKRRSLEPIEDPPCKVAPTEGMAPLLTKLIQEHAAEGGLPPAYLIKDEDQ